MGGFTPLMFAAREGCVECLPILADAGANLNLADPDGITPVVNSIINGHYDVARFLLDRGADRDLTTTGARGTLRSRRCAHHAVFESAVARRVRQRNHQLRTGESDCRSRRRNGAPSTWLARMSLTRNAHRALTFDAFSLAFSMAISEVSIPKTSKFCWESHIALSPVPHPISNALQGFMGVVVTV